MSAACSRPLGYMVLADSLMYLVDLPQSLQVRQVLEYTIFLVLQVPSLPHVGVQVVH